MDKDKVSLTGRSFAEKLNLLIAVCAVLISAASFYATYLQADAAEKQVRATTWPMLEFKHGNAIPKSYEPLIQLKLVNNGVGPAHIQYFRLQWNDKSYRSIRDIFMDCCPDVLEQHIQTVAAYQQKIAVSDSIALMTNGITSPVQNSILSPGSELNFYELPKNEITAGLWEAINVRRWQISASACYCSVLGDCYQTDFVKPAQQVKQCRIN